MICFCIILADGQMKKIPGQDDQTRKVEKDTSREKFLTCPGHGQTQKVEKYTNREKFVTFPGHDQTQKVEKNTSSEICKVGKGKCP